MISASLPWVFMRWLATHLVLVALVGFVLAAIPVFGWVEVPTLLRWETAPAARAESPADEVPPVAAGQGPERTRYKPHEGFSAPVPPPRATAPNPTDTTPGSAFRPPGLVPLTERPALTRDELVQQARRVFWNGEFEAAENAYMELLTRFPGDADLFGELGNLYRAMGKPEQARDAYYAAGLRLKATGELEKLKVIRDLFDAEGDERVTELGN